MNLLPFIELARDENPNELLTADEVAACLYRAAQLAQAQGHDVGLLLKPHGAGGNCPLGRVSLDILIDIPDQQEYDCFSSADGPDHSPGPAIPTWNKLPFKVGVPPSGASMDRVRRPLGAVPEPVPVPPAPVPDPVTPVPAPGTCKATDAAAEVLDALHEMRIEQAKVNELILDALRTLHGDHRTPRRVKIGRWTGDGWVDGIQGR